MSYTFAELFGTNVVATATDLTFSMADLVDANNNPLLAADGSNNADPDKVAAALIAHLHAATTPETDTDGNEIVDKTDGVVAQESFSPRTFEVRDDESQIRHEFNFALYTPDNTTFSANSVV